MATVALGNWGSPEEVPVLTEALSDEEPLVRGHTAGALGQIVAREGRPSEMIAGIRSVLTSRLWAEADEWVRQELALALSS